METIPLKIPVDAEPGLVSAEFMVPDNVRFTLTLSHGAGAGMNHKFMVALAEALATKNVATLRFNFPFIENKKKRVDSPALAHNTIAGAIKAARDKFAGVPLFVSGKSFGGRMTSQHISMQRRSVVKGIIFYGFPLHPAGKPSIERAEHLKNVEVPMLFLQGTKDELATWDLIEKVCNSLPLATLVKIEGADHSFKAGKKDVISMLAEETVKWIESRQS